MVMFRRDADFEAFEGIMQEAHELHPIRILSYCLMSNHWHFVVWPERDGQVTEFFRWLTHTHAMRWRVSHHTVGYGHLYQGRFKTGDRDQRTARPAAGRCGVDRQDRRRTWLGPYRASRRPAGKGSGRREA
jgi:REP element-mobilizing transposase RayT